MIISIFLLVVSIVNVSGAHLGRTSKCRYIPGDRGWPTQRTWNDFNTTVGGRLIQTVPAAHVCHEAGQFSAYDQTACADLKIGIEDHGPATLYSYAGEPMNPFLQNQACSAFTSPRIDCELGNRPSYSLNVSGKTDVEAGLRFVRENNIRMVIKNTGLDYMGKSSGKGALSLWVHNLKHLSVKPRYNSSYYSGPALKVGAGNIAGEVYEFVETKGLRIVGPECGLCGFAGGYTQGVGHSQLASAYGFAADQVLEWEVVTPTGDYIIATPEHHADLYWALSGGGGGTYGVVLSTTVRAYPDGPVAGGYFYFNNTNPDAYWDAVSIWYRSAPSMVVGSPNNIQFSVSDTALWVFAFVFPDQNDRIIHEIMAPFLLELQDRDLPFKLVTYNSSSYVQNLDASYGDLPWGALCPVYPVLSSRLIPRDLVLNETANKNLISIFRTYLEKENWFVGCSFLDTQNSGDIRSPHAENAVNPQWRESIAYCNPNWPWVWENYNHSVSVKKMLSHDFFPAMEAATPGSGVYQNEIDSWYTGPWKDTMYGVNYDRLLAIKHKYDPHKTLYAPFAVGSDEFTIDAKGRLCRL